MHHLLRSELWTVLTLALLSCLLHAALPRQLGHDVFAVLLGALGGVNFGGALKGGDRFDIAVTALGVVMCVAIGVAGLHGPWWIVGAGFLLHAV